MKACSVLGGWIVAILATGAWAQDLPLADTPHGMVFGTERFAVRLDPQTGWAGDVLCNGRVVVKAADTKQAFDLKQDDRWVTGAGSAIECIAVERVAADTIRSRMKVADWSVDAYVQLFPERRMLRRWFEFAWHGPSDTKIRAFWLQAGMLPLAPNGAYFYPAHYPPRRIGAKELVANRKTHSGRSPYPLVAETGDGWSAIWMTNELVDYSDRGSVGATEGERAIRVTQAFNIQGHVRNDVTQKVGDAWLWLQPNDAETALRGMGDWFRLVGQVPPEDRPDWLKRVILYSFHPGGTIGSQCKDLGGFQAAAGLLPHVRRLGCNAIWLMPLEDKSIYWPRDYYKFQEGLGTPDDYKALTAKAHALGMRVWQDCVPHGGGNEFPRAKQHPEWLAQNEDGSTLHYWCFDFNWPTWIAYMSDVVSFYTREYGLDGFRIDACGGSKIPNWNPAIPYARASLSQAQGGFAMQRALRKAVKAIRPDGANLAEVGASVHGAVSDSTYDFELCYSVLHDFRRVPAEVFVPRLRRWLHEQQCAEVPDLVRMRHLESHDSLRSGLWYGARPQRALLALIAWIHGIPMVYHEMEDGNFDVFCKIFHVRSHVPELNMGEADYLSVSAPEGVFACLRTGTVPREDSTAWHADYAWDTATQTPDRASIVLVNLDGRVASGAVSVPLKCLPARLRTARMVRNLMTGEELPLKSDAATCTASVTLPPFGYTVLRFESAALPEMAPAAREEFATTNARSPKDAGRQVELKTGTGVLRIDSATGLICGWQQEGVALAGAMDLVLPRHLAEVAGRTTCRESSAGVEVTQQFGDHTLRLNYSACEAGSIAARAAWQGGAPEGAAMLFDLPAAATWQAQTAEGLFASPFRVRHPGCDGVIGSIYRLPQGTAVAWDSRLHPFGLSPDRGWVGAVSAAGRQTVFAFNPQGLPAHVQVLDRVGALHGMKVLVAWRSADDGVKLGEDELRFRLQTTVPEKSAPTDTGDSRLRLVGGGWEFENAHLRARIARTGALAGLWRKQPDGWQQVLQHGTIYTDRRFAGAKRFGQDADVEATARIEQEGPDIRLSFSGALRGFHRFDKMPRPVRFYSSYTFGDGPAFRYTTAVKPPPVWGSEGAFLALQLQTAGVKSVVFADAGGEFLTEEQNAARQRFAETARSPAPERLPCDVRLSDATGTSLRLGTLRWFGVQPGNVFLHGDALYLAWLDGSSDNRGASQWNGLSCSIACGDAVAATETAVPLVLRGDAALLRNGDFEASASSDTVLLSSAETVARGGDPHDAWQLPAGAEQTVEDGNHYVTIHGDGQSYRLIRQTLPTSEFRPGSKWLLSARVKGQAVERADVSWKTACLRWSVRTNGHTTYATTSLPWGDSPWQTLSAPLTVPEQVESIAVEVGMNGNKGTISIDDVTVEKR